MAETEENNLNIDSEKTDEPNQNDSQESTEESAESKKDRNRKNNDARLLRQRNEAREELQRVAQELAYERGKREALEEAIKHGIAQHSGNELKKPMPEDYDTDHEYHEALVDYKIALLDKNQEPDPKPTKPDPNPSDPSEPPLPPYIQEAVSDMVKLGLEKYDDFRDVVMDPELPITPGIASALAILDNGYDIAYHLANHPSQLNKLANMEDAKAAKEISKLAKTLDGQATKAPEPIKPQEGQTGVSAGVDPSKMSIDEWVKYRNKQARGR